MIPRTPPGGQLAARATRRARCWAGERRRECRRNRRRPAPAAGSDATRCRIEPPRHRPLAALRGVEHHAAAGLLDQVEQLRSRPPAAARREWPGGFRGRLRCWRLSGTAGLSAVRRPLGKPTWRLSNVRAPAQLGQSVGKLPGRQSGRRFVHVAAGLIVGQHHPRQLRRRRASCRPARPGTGPAAAVRRGTGCGPRPFARSKARSAETPGNAASAARASARRSLADASATRAASPPHSASGRKRWSSTRAAASIPASAASISAPA